MIKDLTKVVGQIAEYKYFRVIMILFFGALMAGSGYLAYVRYRVTVQENAQKILAEILDEYSVITSSSEAEELVNLERMLDEGYLRSKSSTLAPVFLAYKSDVQARMGNLDQAQDTLKDALRQLGDTSPFYDLYDIKRMLIDIDRTCGDICGDNVPQGIIELEALAHDSQRTGREVAFQQLADYYNSVGKIDEAQKALKELEKLTSKQNFDLSGSL